MFFFFFFLFFLLFFRNCNFSRSGLGTYSFWSLGIDTPTYYFNQKLYIFSFFLVIWLYYNTIFLSTYLFICLFTCLPSVCLSVFCLFDLSFCRVFWHNVLLILTVTLFGEIFDVTGRKDNLLSPCYTKYDTK